MVTRSLRAQLAILVSIVFAAIPFAFGLIRAVQTRSDFRYLWMAIASSLAAVIVVAIGKARGRASGGILVLSAATFLVAALVAASVGYMFGARSAVGVGIVSAAFAFCFAVSYAIAARSRPNAP